MRTYADIFNRFADVDLAGILGVTPQNFRVMKSRGRIPPDYWPDLSAWAEAHERPLPDGALEQAEIHFRNARAARLAEPELKLEGAAP